MITRRGVLAPLASLGAFGALGLPFAARAEGLNLAKIYCGFPPGGTSDAMSRRVAEKLTGSYARSVIVENKPGAAGQIAITLVKDAPADGSAMLLTPSSMLSLYPYVYKSLPYKPLEDVQPVSIASYFNHAFAVGPLVPASVKTLKDFLAWAKANPAQANYGSPGAGSMPHLIVALLGKITGQELRHIPYKGSAPGIQDLLGGQLAAMSSPVGDWLPYVKTGKVRIIAISGVDRSPFVPDVPTFRQQGFPITMREWYGIFLPGKATPDVARRAAAYLQTVLSQQDLVSTMAQFGLEVKASTPAALMAQLHADSEEWRRVIQQIGFTAES